jgi:hypothetical protein
VIAESVLDDLTADQVTVAEDEVGEVDPRTGLIVRVHGVDAGRQTRDVEVGDLGTRNAADGATGLTVQL